MDRAAAATPKVAVVILNWNRFGDTAACVRSVLESDHSSLELIVVDNGSTDDSAAKIRESFADILLVENAENLGFAEGNNAGIRVALSRGAEYVWLLNNDAVADRHALSEMLAVAERQRDIGVLSGKIYFFDQPDTIWFAGATIDWRRAISAHIGRLEKDSGQYDVDKEIDRVSGCSMLIRREVLEKVGLFDAAFFLYAEEVDYCVRAKRAGYRNYYVPKSIVYHKVSVSSGESGGPMFDYFNTRNFLYLIRKHFPFPEREILLIRNILKRIYRSKGTILRLMLPDRLLKEGNTPHDIAPLKGILHFLTGTMGKGEFDYFLTGKSL